MRPVIAIATVTAAALVGCGAGGGAADSGDVSQYAASCSSSSAPSPGGGDGNAPKCFDADDVKSAMGIGDRAMPYGTPSGAVAAAVAGDRLYIAETMYGTAGQAFTDRKDATIELLRKAIP